MKVLVNNGKRRLGVPGRPAIILDGGASVPITDAQVKDLKRNRTVSRWLNRGVLKIREDDGREIKPDSKPAPGPHVRRPVDRGKREKQVLPEGVTGKGFEIHEKGGGWYDVYVNGFKVTDRSVRKAEAEGMAKDYE